eukprot:2198873-Rhodomonas_salina.1
MRSDLGTQMLLNACDTHKQLFDTHKQLLKPQLNFLRLALEIVAAVALYLHLRLISLPHRPSRDSSRSLKEPAELPKPPDLPDLPEPPGPPDDRPQCGNFWDVPTLYINLDRAADRRVWVEKDLKNLRPVD